MSLIDNVDEIDDLSLHQCQPMRYYFMYLMIAYENSLQYMNEWVWTQCIQHSIIELHNDGIRQVSNEKTIRLLGQYFRFNEILTITLRKRVKN